MFVFESDKNNNNNKNLQGLVSFSSQEIENVVTQVLES